uniref:NADH dehydrogenase subunit 1 n=1 Tax=Silvatares holzenthali TaxID=3026466 RepID=UPI0023D84BC7|nr:NADH dehydrogenase subunit 1 [Silvatares holzenthali]WCR50268.1 NADH dehydrogenase subunit 1 [Silvatares holzenthali]
MNNFDVFISLVIMIFLVVMVLISVAFFTLMERKILGLIQLRKGPLKVGFMGIVQPFNDAIKLFNKEFIFLFMSNYILFFFMPVLILFLSLFLWMIIPYLYNLMGFNLGVLFMLSCMSISVYFMINSGWSSNSNYAKLGVLRGMSQVISYEVCLALFFLSFVNLILSYNFFDLIIFQKNIWFIWFSFPLSLCLFSCMLAELNRTPFDFIEGESELVSGFNVEYSGGGFALIFMGEYASIIFMSMMFCLIFLGGDVYNFFFYLKLMFLGFLFVWVRGTLPRYRYDKLMYLAWKSYLPISLNFLMFFFCFNIYICNKNSKINSMIN